MTNLTGRAIPVFGAIVVASGLEMYAKLGIRPNRHYTPGKMMKAAETITGKKFKSRDYVGAARAIRQWVEAEKIMVRADHLISS